MCTATVSHVIWSVENLEDIEIIFQRGEAGEHRQVNGHVATLLRCSDDDGYTSVLNIAQVDDPDVVTTIECYDVNRTAVQTIRYYHRVAGI